MITRRRGLDARDQAQHTFGLKTTWAGWALMPLMALSIALLGCSQDTTEGAESDSPFGKPSIEIISPQADEVWSEGSLAVKVKVKNFIMDAEALGSAKVLGRGHWHLYLDGEWVGATAEETAALDRVSSGFHHLRVALANNDHSPVLPPVEDTVIVDAGTDDSATAANSDDSDAAPTPSLDDSEWIIPEQDPSNHFVSSNPAQGEEVYYELETITMTFDFNLAPESSIVLTHNGELVPLGSVEISPDQFSMSASIIGTLNSEGVYEVNYKPCWPFLNCHSGSFAFVVEFEESASPYRYGILPPAFSWPR